MTEAELRSALDGGSLAPRAAEVLGLASPSIEIETRPSESDQLAPGRSRVGGLPDLPATVPWPQWRGEPQSHVAQIALAEISDLPGCDVLPPDGLLTFFYSARQDTWGFSPADRGSWTVVHTPAGTPLERRSPPAPVPDGGAYRACAAGFRPGLTLPPWESPSVEALGLGDAGMDAYAELLDEAEALPGHRLCGHPDQIQGDMALECHLVTNGIDTGDPSGWSSARARELIDGGSDWRLLLQIGSDDLAGMMWGDAGAIYYWICEQDLAAGRFDHTWLILQCH